MCYINTMWFQGRNQLQSLFWKHPQEKLVSQSKYKEQFVPTHYCRHMLQEFEAGKNLLTIMCHLHQQYILSRYTSKNNLLKLCINFISGKHYRPYTTKPVVITKVALSTLNGV